MKTVIITGIIAASLSGVCVAQRTVPADANYPSKPIRLIVPQAPGGSNDIMARFIGGQLGERLQKQVVVDNRPGAEGMIGSELVARAGSRWVHAVDGVHGFYAKSGGDQEIAVRPHQGF